MRGLLPVQRNPIGVVRDALLVRILIVVEFRWVVDKDRGVVADCLKSVPAIARNADHLLVMLTDDERIEFTFGWRALTLVVDPDLNASLWADEMVDLSF